MIVTLFLIGFVAAAIAIGLVYTAKAPIGYEDDRGFYYGCVDESFGTNFPKAISPSSDYPNEDEIVALPALFRIRWAKPAWGLIAMCLIFLILGKEEFEKDTMVMSRQIVTSKQPQMASNLFRTVTHNESPKFIQILCQRFHQVE